MRSRSVRSSADPKSAGFSLLEVLIALALLGVAIVSIFQLFSITLRSTKKAEDYTKAVIYARSILDEAYGVADPRNAKMTVRIEDGFKGSREVSLKASSEDGTMKIYEITASVSWPPSGHLRLSALRTIYATEE
ncbi:MAG: prepilin-type N-terminal cleavage/methylation domain-containing protein [Nitrospiraceae bacterium]|nr:prepilin-type N-terminal cleavage/methylation domain-containing protein [Nitrospiraceae bacterium]